MNLIYGIEIKSSKGVEGDYKFVHFCENQIEIRSKYEKSYVLEHEILEKKLSGNLGSFIYPYDAIMCLSDNTKISKSIFKEIMKNANTKITKYETQNLIFDVPNASFEEPEEDEEDDDVESDGEVESAEEDIWEEEEDEEISEDNDDAVEF